VSARRRLTASQSFAIAVALLVVVGVLGTVASLLALSNLNDARVQLTDRLSPAVISASDFRSALIDQETGIRGYALTGDESFLQPYESGLREEAAARAELERLSGQQGLERFRSDIEAVLVAARAWQTDYALPTIALVKADPAQARTPAAASGGKVRFDAFRRQVAQLQDRIAPVRAQARDTLDHSADVVLFWVLGTGIVILLSVVAVAWVLRGTIVLPVQRLAGAVRGVARGDFEREVSGSGAREVMNLGEDVDAMRARIVSELEALRVAESDLRRSNAELEQFAYVASHDLQEPLRKVASFCQLLQQRYGGQLDARADQYIGFAVDGAQRMQDLINDLLSFSRVGRMEQPLTDVDCVALMTRVRADLGRAIEENDAELIVGELPTVRGDAGLLRVVYQNLCVNAIKFRGVQPPVVHLDAERDGEFWRFRVSDNGIGIDPGYAERIFVLFQRLHPRTQYEGTGIGLAMCRKIVEHHGGRMWLDAEPAGDGQGSTFYFTLPAEPPET
jgi:signal transduction histidine kinase